MKENWFNEPRGRRVIKVPKEKMGAVVSRVADGMNNGPEPRPWKLDSPTLKQAAEQAREDVQWKIGALSKPGGLAAIDELWFWAFSSGGVHWVGEGLENALGSLEHLRRYGRQPVPQVRWVGRIPAPVRVYLEHHGIDYMEKPE